MFWSYVSWLDGQGASQGGALLCLEYSELHSMSTAIQSPVWASLRDLQVVRLMGVPYRTLNLFGKRWALAVVWLDARSRRPRRGD